MLSGANAGADRRANLPIIGDVRQCRGQIERALVENCGNCGATIGELETPYVYGGHVVCRSCYAKLQPKDKRARLLISVASATLVMVLVVGVALRLARSKPETRAPDQSPPTVMPVIEPLDDDDIFAVIRQHADARPQQLQEFLSKQITGRRSVYPGWNWAVDERNAYKDGIRLSVKNPDGDAAGIERALEILRANPDLKDQGYGTAIIKGKVYSIYGFTFFLKGSQTQQAAAIPLGTTGISAEGNIGIFCSESDGVVTIYVLVGDAEFR